MFKVKCAKGEYILLGVVDMDGQSAKRDCTLLINTCDSYSDCWDGFFQLLQIQYLTMDMPIVLNTEAKKYSFKNMDITTMQLDKKYKMSWGKRLRETFFLSSWRDNNAWSLVFGKGKAIN